MPLTTHQKNILAELAASEGARERYLAGGAALHFSPNSIRFSDDLDFFHDTVAQVDRAFQADRGVLEASGYQVGVSLNIPGFIRAVRSPAGEGGVAGGPGLRRGICQRTAL